MIVHRNNFHLEIADEVHSDILSKHLHSLFSGL